MHLNRIYATIIVYTFSSTYLKKTRKTQIFGQNNRQRMSHLVEYGDKPVELLKVRLDSADKF